VCPQALRDSRDDRLCRLCGGGMIEVYSHTLTPLSEKSTLFFIITHRGTKYQSFFQKKI
jgi:hypothetical protein